MTDYRPITLQKQQPFHAEPYGDKNSKQIAYRHSVHISMQTCRYILHVYGPDGRIADTFQQDVPLPRNIWANPNVFSKHMQTISSKLVDPYLSNRSFRCCGCGAPLPRRFPFASETHTEGVTIPTFTDIWFPACDIGECGREAQVLMKRVPELQQLRGEIPGSFGCGYPSCSNSSQRPKQEMKRCSRCKTVIYCGVECQKADWPRHKLICATKT